MAPVAASSPASGDNSIKQSLLLLLVGLLAGSLLTWSLVRKDEGPASLPAGNSPVARVPVQPEPAPAGGEIAQPVAASPVAVTEAAGGPSVDGFPDGPEERIAQVLNQPGLSPSQKADQLMALLRTTPLGEQQAIIRHVACLYPDKEWFRYRDLLADPYLDASVRQTALETLERDRPSWLLVEAVSMVLQNPRDPLRSTANQILKERYPQVADYDLLSFRTLARKEHDDSASSTAKKTAW